MKLPRDVAGRQLVKALRKLGYAEMRQKGSHIRVTTEQDGKHHEVIPDHNPIKCGTLNGILKSVANQCLAGNSCFGTGARKWVGWEDSFSVWPGLECSPLTKNHLV